MLHILVVVDTVFVCVAIIAVIDVRGMLVVMIIILLVVIFVLLLLLLLLLSVALLLTLMMFKTPLLNQSLLL